MRYAPPALFPCTTEKGVRPSFTAQTYSTHEKCLSAQGLLQSPAHVACSTGVVYRGLRLRVAQQCVSCALVRGRGLVVRHYYQDCKKCWERLS